MTVGLGGYITGGGHSLLAPHYGLAIDQVLELEMVTPKGEIITANECQNQDLFWAMRGGGGGTFGVMTSVTVKTYPTPQLVNLNWAITAPADSPVAWDMITYLVSQFPSLADQEISGYPIIFQNQPDPNSGGTKMVTGIMGMVVMINTMNTADILKVFQPHFDHINATWPGVFSSWVDPQAYPTLNAWFKDRHDPSPVGYEHVMSSRLLDTKALTSNLTATKAALQKFAAGGSATVYIVSGKGVHNAQPRGGGAAVMPAWRKTYVHATSSAIFVSHNRTARAEAVNTVGKASNALKELAPDMGAYINEGDRFDPEWQKTFWGENYDRLLRIKRDVDPNDVFWCQPCVGHDRWEEVDDRLCMVSK